jgi:hypothetical protein
VERTIGVLPDNQREVLVGFGNAFVLGIKQADDVAAIFRKPRPVLGAFMPPTISNSFVIAGIGEFAANIGERNKTKTVCV